MSPALMWPAPGAEVCALNQPGYSRSSVIGAPLVGMIVPAVLILVALGAAWSGQNARRVTSVGWNGEGCAWPAGCRGRHRNAGSAGRIVARTKTDARGRFHLSEGRGGTYALLARKKGFRPATMIVGVPLRAQKPLDLVLASDEPLTMQVSANRIRVQNTLTQTGASKYTSDQSRHQGVFPRAKRRRSMRCCCRCRGWRWTRTRRFMSAANIWGFSTR